MSDPVDMDESEAVAFLAGLFPAGPLAEDVLSELRADCWPDAAADLDTATTLGDALWAVFSDNNDVVAPDGRIASLGTWRGSGEVIAGFLNARVADARFRYIDFYMSGHIGDGPSTGVARWQAAVRLVFRRLRARGGRWVRGNPHSAAQAEHDRVWSEPA